MSTIYHRKSLLVNLSLDADAFYRYGGGSGPIYYAGFHCTGEETSLIDCAVDQEASFEEIANCQHFEDAGVHCTNG